MLIVKCLVGLEKILSTGIFNTIQHKKYKIFETTRATLEISLPSKLLITSSPESTFLKRLKSIKFFKSIKFLNGLCYAFKVYLRIHEFDKRSTNTFEWRN